MPRHVTLRLPERARDAFTEFEDDRFDLTYHVLGMPEEYSASIQDRQPTEAKNLPQRMANNVDAIKGLDAL